MIALALMLAQMEPWKATGSWRMYGPVNASCGQWLMDKDDEAKRLVQLGWAGGFLSGINLAAGGKITDVDTPSLAAYVDQQFVAKPLTQVPGIVFEFYYRLRTR